MNKHKYQQPNKNDVLFEKKKRNPPISFCKFIAIVNKFFWINVVTQLTFTCLKSTIQTLEKEVKYVQSYQ